ncbi:alpha-mannosidase 2C1 isoform X1 [Rhipicephalus microplus]|uniref:alpha-mannosidase 2C1 isoform X1 n=2 Tax=Rhipicephalus microplus TaxID=6941 RepID=UPI003F6CCB51
MASLFKNKRSTLERVEKFVSPVYFTDVNLYGRIYPEAKELTSLSVWSTPDRVSFDEASKRPDFVNTSVGAQFGPTWTTCWFKIVIDIPNKWCGKEVHLRWDSESEALLFTKDGKPLQGLSGGVSHQERQTFTITPSASVSCLHYEFFLEMACNHLFGAGTPTMISAPDPKKTFTLKKADVAVYDKEVDALVTDLELLAEMARELPKDGIRSYEALYAANEIVNCIDVNDRSSLKAAKDIADRFFGQRNGECQHTIAAIGNCHIDTAWLWPYAETKRKCARSFASALLLMEKFPEYTFACSQAQQLSWVKESYPSLFERIQQYAKKGQFIPVGGTWVEMDGNLPSGESFVRQFLYGQLFFEKEFGTRCKEFWLPDTFGYSAQLPQIMRMCGVSRFLTQKLSWNLVNKFPHHNFVWEGLDGSTVLAHFAPSETYGAELRVAEVVKTVTNLEDKGRVSHSILLFGHGDGGGGPTEAMLRRQLRLQDVCGLPKVTLSTPDAFFSVLESESRNLCRWSGELFLELHNATYTTHARTKQLNRMCEEALRDAEMIYSVVLALAQYVAPYPCGEFEGCWKDVLVNQFHDVLPGTCIAQAREDAQAINCQVLNRVRQLSDEALEKLFGTCDDHNSGDLVFVNTLSWSRSEIVLVPWNREELSKRCWIEGVDDNAMQETDCGTLVSIVAPSAGYKVLRGISSHKVPVLAVKTAPGVIRLRNQFLEAKLNNVCEVSSLKILGGSKELVCADRLANVFVMFDDIPLYWDAWDVMDYHLETGRPAVKQVLEPATILEQGPLKAAVRVKFTVGVSSVMTQTVIIDAVHPYLRFDTEVEWKENHKFLKVEFPVNILSRRATYEIQFGNVERPTHSNTSWDWAKYEVYGHKWIDLSEHGHGVALLNTCKYGHAVHGNVMRLSLLRAPKSPDPEADMGHHKFTYALMPHQGTLQEAGVIQQAYELGYPLKAVVCNTESKLSGILNSQKSLMESASWFQVSCPAVVLETVKRAERHPDAIVLRFYEAYGGEATAAVTTFLPVARVVMCNALEDGGADLLLSGGTIQLVFKPFQVVSVLVFLKTLTK